MSKDAAKPKPASKPEAKPKVKKPPRRWRRRFRRGLLMLIAVVLVLRIALGVAMPWIVDRVAADFDLHIEYERLDISLLSGDIELSHLKLTPRSGGVVYAEPEYLRADLSMWHLLVGQVVIRRLEVDGLDLDLVREADGQWALLRHFPLRSAATAPVQSTGPASARGFNFVPPIRIDAARMQHVRAKITDKTQSPPFVTTINLTARVSNLGSQQHPLRYDLSLAIDGVLKDLRISGEATSSATGLHTELTFELLGLRAAAMSAYLEALGVTADAEHIDLSFAASVSAQAVGPLAQKLAAHIQIDRLVMLADGQKQLALDSVVLDVTEIDPLNVHIAKVQIEGLQSKVELLPGGQLRSLGLRFGLLPTPRSQPPPTTPWPHIEVDRIVISTARMDVIDRFIQPVQNLGGIIEQLEITGLVLDPKTEQAPLNFDARFSFPGVVRSVHIVGQAAPFNKNRTLDLQVVADGIAPQKVRSYLAAFGIETLLRNARLSFNMAAQVELDDHGVLLGGASLTDLELTDEGKQLGRLDRFVIAGLSLDLQARRCGIESIELIGSRVNIVRTTDAKVELLGLRIDPDHPALHQRDAIATTPATATSNAARKSPFEVKIGKLTVSNHALSFTDESTKPAVKIQVDDLRLAVTGVALGSERRSEPFALELFMPGIVEHLAVSGTLLQSGRGMQADVTVVAKGITATAIRPYLEAFGITPALDSGDLKLQAVADLSYRNDGLSGNLKVTDLAYTDADVDLFRLDVLHITDVVLDGPDIAVESVVITGPQLVARREADGVIAALGFRFDPASVRQQAAAIDIGGLDAVVGQGTDEPPEGSTGQYAINTFALTGFALRWSDDALDQPISLAATIDASLNDLTVAGQDASARFTFDLSVAEHLQALHAAGSLTIKGPDQRVEVDLVATGIRTWLLTPYLPQQIGLPIADGRLKTRIEASTRPATDGGQRYELRISDFDWRDGPDEMLLLFDALRAAGRVDLADGVVVVEELSLAGLESVVVKADDGAIQFAGIAFEPAAAIDVLPGEPEQEAAPPEPTPPEHAPLLWKLRKEPPLVRIEKLDLDVRRFTYRDESRPGIVPLELVDLRIKNTAPLLMLGDDAEQLPPAAIEITASLPQLIDQIQMRTQLTPFASEPGIALELQLTGIRGSGLVERMPGLAEMLDASALDDGRMQFKANAILRFRRRHSLDFNLAPGFGAELSVEELTISNGTLELFAIDECLIDLVKVMPETGDLHIKSIALAGVRGSVVKEARGLRLLNVLLKLPDAAAPAEAVSSAATTQKADASQAVPKDTAAPPELRLDTLDVQGLRWRIEDRSVEPPVVLPLEELDFEVRGLTTRALREPVPIRFRMGVRSSKVLLPLDPPVEREAFGDIAVSGHLTLFPQPTGWIKASVSALELSNLRGAIAAYDVDLTDGVFDTGMLLRFEDDGDVDVSVDITLTDLDASEPADGPIGSLLKLSMPLNVTIFVLRDAGGAIDLPLDFKVGADGLSWPRMFGAASTALASLVARAVANVPRRVLNIPRLVIRLGGDDDQDQTEEQPLTIAFGPSATMLAQPGGAGGAGETGGATIAEVLDRLEDDADVVVTLSHELGSDDLVRVRVRANPSLAQCRELAAGMRRRKHELLQSRALIAAQAQAALGSGRAERAEATRHELGDLDRELGLIEAALDDVLSILTAQSQRQMMRRTRQACAALGAMRTVVVRRALLASNVEAIAQRITIQPARYDDPTQARGQILVRFSRQKRSE